MKDEKLKRIFKAIINDRNKGIELFHREYKQLIYKISFSILKNKEDAEDVIQNISKKLYILENNKFPQNHEMSWLYSMVKNESISLLRRKKNNISLEEIYEISDENDEISKIIEKDKYNRLIKGLSDKEKQVVSMKVLSGFSFKEIGKLLGEPEGTIKWRYYKSLYSLRLMLGNISMFIINFVIGIKLFKKNQRNTENSNNIQNSSAMDRIQETDKESSQYQDSVANNRTENTYRETENVINTETEVETNTIQEEPQGIKEDNYMASCFIGLSMFFLIIFMILLFSYIKHQLKLKVKSSNN